MNARGAAASASLSRALDRKDAGRLNHGHKGELPFPGAQDLEGVVRRPVIDDDHVSGCRLCSASALITFVMCRPSLNTGEMSRNVTRDQRRSVRETRGWCGRKIEVACTVGRCVKDLAIVIVSSPGSPGWLLPCIRTALNRTAGLTVQVVVADSDPGTPARPLLAREFGDNVHVVACTNRGFAHGNNQALACTNARYVLFLNPDTEVIAGEFGDLLRLMDDRPGIGLAGVRQVTPDGKLFPTIRRFPNGLRALGEALGSERVGLHRSWLGERVLETRAYDRETVCDWTSGSFMLVRRNVLRAVGLLDERFFLYSEEVDLCRRIKSAGWEVVHLPQMTIIHHADKAGVDARLVAQQAYSRMLYAQKHFPSYHRRCFTGAVYVRHALRAVLGASRANETGDQRRASRHALRVLRGRELPPFGCPPPQSLWPEFRQAIPELREASEVTMVAGRL